jgi:hypothetical protein
VTAGGERPTLSVVVPFVNGLDDLRGCLAALDAERRRHALEVIVVERHGPETGAAVAAEFPWVRVLSAEPGTPIPRLRALAFGAARAPSVAVIEDHVLVPDGWVDQLLAARARGERVVGGSVRNAATDRLVDWAAFLCEYSRYLPPLPSGSVASLPGNNTVYDRDLLARYGAVVAEGGWEDRLHEAMRRDGVDLWARPEIVVGHKMHYTIWLYTSQRYLYSRAFAGARVAGAPFARRLAMGLAALGLPPILFWRIGSTIWRKRLHRRELARSLPLLVWFVVAWGAGEVVGYWFGSGDAFGRVR